VSYRSQHPDEATQEEVMKVLRENKIDISKLVKWPVDHCQQGEPSTEEENSE